MEKLRADNERLLSLLKNTSEYGEISEVDIMNNSKSLNTSAISGGKTNGRSKSLKGGSSFSASKKISLTNEWIPTEAVRVI